MVAPISAATARPSRCVSHESCCETVTGMFASARRAGAFCSRMNWTNSNPQQEMDSMAKGQQRGNREAKKPKKEKAKIIAAAPSRKELARQPDFGPSTRR